MLAARDLLTLSPKQLARGLLWILSDRCPCPTQPLAATLFRAFSANRGPGDLMVLGGTHPVYHHSPLCSGDEWLQWGLADPALQLLEIR